MKFNKQDYSIYCENYSQYINIQKYFFSINIAWCSPLFNKTIFTKDHWTATNNFTFPRYIRLNYDIYTNRHTISNVVDMIDNTNDPEIKASTLLRKLKLQKINENR